MSTRKIIHVDMDCFYAAVEVLDNPGLKGKPVIVGGPEGRGVVCAASYEARKYGVHSAMPISRAKSLCQSGVFLPVRMSRYVEISRKIKEIFFRATDLVQSISLDEAFLDVTVNKTSHEYATELAKEIKKNIRTELGMIASAGVAPNKFLAKIASEYKKPDGFFVIKPHEVQGFMKELPVSKIWGVGKVMTKKLSDLGIQTCADLEEIPSKLLEAKFGKFGRHLLKLAQGIDDSPVVPFREPKSVGQETTLRENITQMEVIEQVLRDLSSKVSRRLYKKEIQCGGVQLKVKYDDFKVSTRSLMLDDTTQEEVQIFNAAKSLLKRTKAGEQPIRLLGVSVNHLSVAEKAENLFDFFNSGLS